MATHLIAYGHGAGDPGAVGNGTNERDFNRKVLHPHIKKWADKSKHTFAFYDITGNKDLYKDTANGWGIYGMTAKRYASITEIHEDAASSSATGGHVIINKAFKPDSNDLGLAGIINRIVGWWGSVKNTKGISYRNNLLNCNVAANRGINYRLMELGFITNSSDMSKIRNNLDTYAKGIVEGITGETLSDTVTNTPSTPSTPKTALKVGDKVKVKALYVSSTGGGKSTKSAGKIGVIKRDVGKGKRYLVENWGWAHANDIQLVSRASTSKPSTPAKPTPAPKPVSKAREYAENGTFTITDGPIALRLGNTPNSKFVSWLGNGQSVKYDRVRMDVNGHVWVRQTPKRKEGYAWIATGKTNANAQRGNNPRWGTFK